MKNNLNIKFRKNAWCCFTPKLEFSVWAGEWSFQSLIWIYRDVMVSWQNVKDRETFFTYQFWPNIIYFENIINILWNTLIWQKRESPPVGFEPDASHLPDECPTARPQRIPNLSQITYPSDSCVVTELWPIIYKASSAHPIHASVFTTAHLFRASAWMAYHHLNNKNSQVF